MTKKILYEYEIKFKCPSCGAQGKICSGVQGSRKTEVESKICPACFKEKVTILKVKEYIIEKIGNKIKITKEVNI